MKRFSLSALACSTLLAVFATPLAAIGVGDKPEFEFPIYNSEETVTNLDLRGKLVVIIFWSAEDRDSVAALGMMNVAQAAEQAAGVGAFWGLASGGLGNMTDMPSAEEIGEAVEFIAVSVDQGRRERNVRRALEQASFSGTVVYDRDSTGLEIARNWGVESVPAVAILVPNGEIALFEDAESEPDMDSLTRFFDLIMRYPPLMTGDKERAEQQLAAAESAVDAGDESTALDALSGFPTHAAYYFDEMGERYRTLSARLNPLGERELERVRRMVERGEVDQARAELAELIDSYESLPVGRTFRDELKRLNYPPVKARQQAGQAMQGRVARLVARAEQLIASGRRVDAHRKLSFIVERFPSTKATDRARQILDELSNDENFKREQRAERTRRVCERLLAEADALLAEDDLAGARAKWRQILEQYGDSDFATTAQDKLDEHR